MTATLRFLDAVKRQLSITSDYRLAKELGLTRSAVSKYRRGIGNFDNLTAVKVAEILKLPPLRVIATIEAERTKRPTDRQRWQELAKIAMFATALIGAGIFTGARPTEASPSTAQSASEIYIMRRRRHAWNS